MYRNGALAIT